MFTIDPASGDTDRLVIEGSFGLGEAVVSGSVSPDRYLVEKDSLAIIAREVRRKELVIEPRADGGTVTRELQGDEANQAVLTDDEVREVASLGRGIEEHYGAAQDTEWCYDADGTAWMLQSRPVTSAGGAPAEGATHDGEVLVRGLGAAPGTGSGRVRVVRELADAQGLGDGDVLVTHMTAPDWVPLMRRSAAIITDSGGMTCHAAIVSRELGIPCVVGTAEATTKLRDGELVTVEAGQGVVREGAIQTGRAAPVAPAAVGGRAGHRNEAARQPLRAVPGRARQRARRRGRRPLARRADGPRGARGQASAAADGAGTRRRDRRTHERGAEHLRRRRSRHGRSPTGRSTSAPTSSAGSRAASASSPRRRTR